MKNISATMRVIKTGDAEYFGQPGGPERKQKICQRQPG
jgi:hypothetical protein